MSYGTLGCLGVWGFGVPGVTCSLGTDSLVQIPTV